METILREGLSAWGLSDGGVPRLLDFSRRLLAQNEVMNLTAITAPADVARLHLLDCAALLSHYDLRGKTVVDVGTGAGFPGMVLRILEPTCRLTLLDSLGKRVDWLREVCAEMGLSDVDCVHARAEDFAGEQRERFDIAASRAVAPLNILCELALPLVRVGGMFLAMKSVESDAELDAAKNAVETLGGEVAEVWDYTIPTAAVRHRVIAIGKPRPTPPRFPRPYAKIKKQPLK